MPAPPSRTAADGDRSWLRLSAAAGAVVFLIVAAIGSYVGYWVLLSDRPFDDGSEIERFTSTGEYVLWVLLVVGQVGLWSALLVALIPPLRELWPAETERGRLATPAVLAVVFFAVLVGLTLVAPELGQELGPDFRNPFPNYKPKLIGIAVFGAFVAAVATFGMGLVHEHLADVTGGDLRAARTIERFLRLRVVLHRLLVVEATILGSAILSLAALRGAIVAVEGLAFPQTLLIGYGLAGSAALLSVYAPVYASVLGAGRRLLNAATPIPSTSKGDWSDELEKRTKLESILRIDSSIASNVQAVLAILTPLVGSVLGVIVDIE